jgi:hypothetical protein
MPENQRDSGIAMDFDSRRSSAEIGLQPPVLTNLDFGSVSSRKSAIHLRTPSLQSSYVDPSEDNESPRKSFLHLRTPSLHDLKKIASVGNLHRRSVSATRSPEKEETPDISKELRRSISRKDLAKQVKLSRRVSDLEMKLEAARMELHSALGEPDASSPALKSSLKKSLPRPISSRQSNSGTWRGRFAPALPTLLSESLLPVGRADNEDVPVKQEDDEMFGSALSHPEERPKTRSFSGDGLYSIPNQPLNTTFESPTKSVNSDVVDLVEPASQQGKNAFTVTHELPPLPFEALPSEPPKKTLKKVPVKKRKSTDDAPYRIGKDNAQSDSEWEEAKSKTLKKKRTSNAASSPKASASPKNKKVSTESDWDDTKSKTLRKRRPGETTSSLDVESSPPKMPPKMKISRKSVGSGGPVKTSNVLTKPQPIPKDVELPALETVHEETIFTSTVALKDAPCRPTARATPAHPGRGRSRSRSPTKSPQKQLNLNGLPYTYRERRSMSPPPSSTHEKTVSPEKMRSVSSPDKDRGWSSPDNPVSVRPGEGDAPPLPILNFGDTGTSGVEGEGKNEDFEWPDDVF